jgi:hypothetical protein
MFKQSILLCISFICLASTSIVQAEPKNILLEYDVTRNGKPFAKVKEQYKQDGKSYQIESVTKGIGFYALFGERKMLSKGEVTNEGLKPEHFELTQSDNPNKNLLAEFDWTKKSLVMLVKGETKSEQLSAGTQDLASYAYQFMFVPPKSDGISVTLTTGKKLNQYTYKTSAQGQSITLSGVDYKTTLIESSSDKGKKSIWLSESNYYLPVRYQLHDENGELLEQSLTKIQMD